MIRRLSSRTLEEIHERGILRQGQLVAEEYEVLEYKGGGGSGEVYRLSHPLYGDSRVIKLFIPYYYIRQLSLPTLEGEDAEETSITQLIMKASERMYISRNEFRYLSSLDHPFIVKVHGIGRTGLDNEAFASLKAKVAAELTEIRKIPYIITSHVEGAKLTPVFAAKCGRDTLFTALLGIAQALDYIHGKKSLLHCDVKAGNVLVRSDGFPVLVDFALSIDVGGGSGGEGDEIVASIDSDYAPPITDEPDVQRAIGRLARQGLPRNEVRSLLFPHLDRYQFGKLVKECVHSIGGQISSGEREYLDELTGRLTTWSWLKDHPDVSLAELAARLDTNRTYPILRVESAGGGLRLPAPTGSIKVAGPLVEYALHPALVRLNRLNQLSLLPARFPGATHTRFLHSLDTYRLARGLSRRLLDNPRFRIVFAEKDVRDLLMCAMLHDINHVPLMHVFQESELSVYKTFDLFDYNLGASHEGAAPLAELIERDVGLQRFRRIISDAWEDQAGPSREVDQVISSMLNAGVDVDKLSYLRLDSLYSGRDFGSGVDIEGLFEAADVVQFEETETSTAGKHLAFHQDAISLLEGVVGARLRAFRELYWCGENRAMMACVLDRVRQVASAGGSDELKRLIQQTASMPDYSVLLELDSLAEQRGVGGPRVSSFFETYADQVVSVYRTSRHHEQLVRLDVASRFEFDRQVREAILERIHDRRKNHLVLVDVPHRALGVGGRLLVAEGDRGIPAADISEAIRAHERSFDELHRQVQVFCSTEVAERLGETFGSEEDRYKWLDNVLKRLLRGGTFE